MQAALGGCHSRNRENKLIEACLSLSVCQPLCVYVSVRISANMSVFLSVCHS